MINWQVVSEGKSGDNNISIPQFTCNALLEMLIDVLFLAGSDIIGANHDNTAAMWW